MPEIFDLAHFDSYREDNRLEVKAANGGLPGTLWDTYSSFANSYGGCIICGVVERKDGSWKTTGLRDLPKLKKSFWDTVHNKTKVSLCLVKEKDVEEYVVGEDVILVIKVPRATREQKPIYINNDVFGSTFRRDHEGDYHCSEAEVKAMIRDEASEDTPDKRVLDRKLDFDTDTIKGYCSRIFHFIKARRLALRRKVPQGCAYSRCFHLSSIVGSLFTFFSFLVAGIH